ncbi:MFS transporter [Actinoplanes awajinensis]|uniref:MFS transporter n=1 Tax=Actinoplanes awajinensis subsp. mycoplanecinus TaxID=135947 RepID=A0A101JG78_9ACTN|nr:MFS transporter [Actinoplanes awajinensis]KUL26175.1 MFS transporter [Actinoplanes awajinensis subsp. mycoplanecinus]
MTALWRNREFNLLWTGQCFSDLGDAIAQFALPLLVLMLTGSPVQAGIVGTVAKVAGLASRLPVGVLVDRVNRRWALLGADAARLLSGLAFVALILSGHAGLPVIIAVAVVDAVAGSVFFTTERAALSSIVAKEQLPAAVARNEARGYGVALAGPPLGGLLFGIGHALPFIGNTISYLASMIGVALIRRPLQRSRAETPDRYTTALAEGVRYVARQPFLRAVLLIAAPLNFAINGVIFTIVVSLQQTGTAPAVIGLTETVIAVGGLTGAFFAPLLQRRLRMATLTRMICTAATLLLLLSAVLMTGLAAAAPVAVTLFLAPACNAAIFGHLAATTPDRLQGRVLSVIFLAANSAAAAAPLLAGVLVTHGGGTVTVLVFAASVAVSAVSAAVHPGLRQETRTPADNKAIR